MTKNQLPQKVLVICGPTASGKTTLGLKLAKILNGAIVSVDARQAYEGLDIGSGKDIPPNFLKSNTEIIPVYSNGEITIYGYDVFKPDSLKSPSQMERMLTPIIKKLQDDDTLPILISGSGNYLQALLSPPKTAHIPPNLPFRLELEQFTVTQLQEKLKQLDERKISQMNSSDIRNPRRLIRAIEVATFQKKFKPTLLKENHFYDPFWLGISYNKDQINQRITNRVNSRLKLGVIAEVKQLIHTNPDSKSVLAATIGYKQILKYLSGEITKELMISEWILKENQYAKRQLTWFKQNSAIHWINAGQPDIDSTLVKLIQSWKA